MTEFAFREPRDILDSPLGHELEKLEKQIRAGEATAIEARWFYGHALLRRRVGKQLPNGLLDALIARDGVSRREIQYRIQFAQTYPTQEEVRTAVRTYKSWDALRKSFSKSSGGEKTQTNSRPAFLIRRLINQLEEATWAESDLGELDSLIDQLIFIRDKRAGRRAAK